jgi:hypothetical protein
MRYKSPIPWPPSIRSPWGAPHWGIPRHHVLVRTQTYPGRTGKWSKAQRNSPLTRVRLGACQRERAVSSNARTLFVLMLSRFGSRTRFERRTVLGVRGSGSAPGSIFPNVFEPGSNAERRNPITCHSSDIIRLFIRLFTIYRHLFNILIICNEYYLTPSKSTTFHPSIPTL